MRSIHRCSGLALLACAGAQAQAPTAGSAALTLQGRGPYHTLAIPLGLRSAADRGELQLLNARGEALSFAWAPAWRPRPRRAA